MSNISSASGAYFGSGTMNAVSGASSWVPSAGYEADTAVTQMRSDIRQDTQDFKSLKTALNSGDLSSATQAYATLQQDIQTASRQAGGKSPFDPGSPIAKDFQAVGNALKSGDLSAAQQAFATFRQDIRSAGRATAQPQISATNGGQDSADSSAQNDVPHLNVVA